MSKTKFGRYEVLSELGRGGMSTVYLASDTRFDRPVALKVLPQQFSHDPSFYRRFVKEAQVIASLEHFAIVPVYDFGEEDGFPYFVMRYMQGSSLVARIASGPLPMPDVITITHRICAALDEAHRRGIVHRDLKPGNILFDLQNNAYLADFGIARLVEETSSFTGSALIGTPSYMSPEQVHGSKDIGGRSDIYNMGIILFEMLAGQLPFQAETPTKQMMAHVLDPVPDILQFRPDLPRRLGAIVAQALAKDPAERFQTAGELSAAITTIVGSGVSKEMMSNIATVVMPSQTGQADTSAPLPKQRFKLSLWLWSIIGILAIGATAWGVRLVAGNPVAPPSPTALSTVTLTEAAQKVVIVPTPAHTPTSTPTPGSVETSSPTWTKTVAATKTNTPKPTSSSTATRTQTPTAVAPTAVFQVKVDGSSVNLRAGPGTAYNLVPGQPFLPSGETALVLARDASNTWFNVELESGVRGWVAAVVVNLVQPHTPEEIPLAVTIPPAPTPTYTPTRAPLPTHTSAPTPQPTQLPNTLEPRTPTPVLVPTTRRTLRLGDTGDDVALLQNLLSERGFPVVDDGIFGPMTDLAVRDFQRSVGLVVDGIVGPITWEALLNP